MLVGGAQFLGGLGAWGGEAPLVYMVSSLGIDSYKRSCGLLLVLAILAWIVIPDEKKDIDNERLAQFKLDLKATLKTNKLLQMLRTHFLNGRLSL